MSELASPATNQVMFEVARRDACFVKIGIAGVSGSGKTYTALLIARGITGDWQDIYVIDTEHRSSSLYSHLGGFWITPLNDHSFQGYYMALYYALLHFNSRYNGSPPPGKAPVIIIDSGSHFWAWLLDYHSKLNGKDSFANWKLANPFWENFKNMILQSNCHIIVTLRRETEYKYSQDERGRNQVSKVGLKIKMREGLDYELTTLLEIDENNECVATKDRTGLFSKNQKSVLKMKDGLKIYKWCNDAVNKDMNSVENRLVSFASLLSEIDEEDLLQSFYAQNEAFVKEVPDAMQMIQDKLSLLQSLNNTIKPVLMENEMTHVEPSSNYVYHVADMSIEKLNAIIPTLASSHDVLSFLEHNKAWFDQNQKVKDQVEQYRLTMAQSGR